MICSNVVGLVGEPFSIETTSNFETATLTFKIDQTKLGEIEFDNLLFLWYDEENYKFVELDTSYDKANSLVSIKTTHFSRYMVVDKFQWYEAWAVKFNYNPRAEGTHGEPNVYHNTVLAIDCSGSMDTYDKIRIKPGINSAYDALFPKTCQRIEAATEFIRNMNNIDKTAVVLFTNSASTAQKMTDNKEDLRLALQNITSDGGTSFYDALTESYNAFEEGTIGSIYTDNRIILLSDGEDGSYSKTLSLLNSIYDKNSTDMRKSIKIYTIGLGSAYDSVLEEIAKISHGEFFKAYTADELLDIYTKIGIDGDFDTTDTDGDGLYDAVEAAGIRIQNGKILKNDYDNNIVYTNPAKRDTDNDGLSDGEEIDPTIRWRKGSSGEREYYFFMKSDPSCEDSDGDGLLDGTPVKMNDRIIAPTDPNPTEKNGPDGMWKEHINNVKYGSIPTELDGWYGYSGDFFNDLENIGVEGFLVLADEIQRLVNNSDSEIKETNFQKYIDKAKKNALISLNTASNYFKMALDELKECFPADRVREIEAELGSSFLNFKEDYKHVLHSQFKQWQAMGGYNNTYDFLFRFFTNDNMDSEKFRFSVSDTEYIFWIWRGDYLNLGAGSEIGIYSRPSSFSQDPDKLDHYFVDTELSMPMKLYLYNYENSENIENIFSWEPTAKQWWITGFNPAHAGNVDVHKQFTVGKITMSQFLDENGNNEMFNSLRTRVSTDSELSDYMYFDEDSYNIWIMWGELYEKNN